MLRDAWINPTYLNQTHSLICIPWSWEQQPNKCQLFCITDRWKEGRVKRAKRIKRERWQPRKSYGGGNRVIDSEAAWPLAELL